jgi:hypothetical protein
MAREPNRHETALSAGARGDTAASQEETVKLAAVIFIEPEDVMHAHAEAIAAFGGSDGLRSERSCCCPRSWRHGLRGHPVAVEP